MKKKIPDGLTIRVTTNVKKKTTTVMSYRVGGYKRAFKAVLPMCPDEKCRKVGTHVERRIRYKSPSFEAFEEYNKSYHQRDVDVFIGKLINTYR